MNEEMTMTANPTLPPNSPHRQSRLGTARVYFDLAREHANKNLFHKAIKILEIDAPRSLELARNYLHLANLLSKDPSATKERDECHQHCKRILDSLPVNTYLTDVTQVDESFDPRTVGRFCGELGAAYFQVGNLDDAHCYMGYAIQLFERSIDRGVNQRDFQDVSDYYYTMTHILLQQDVFHEAVDHFINALGCASHITSKLLSLFHEIVSSDFNWEGYTGEVRRCSLRIDYLVKLVFLKATEPLYLGRAHCMLALALYKLGNLDEAQVHTDKAVQIFGEHSPESQDSWRSQYVMAQIMIERKAFKDAATLLQKAAKITQTTKSMLDLATTYRDLGLVFHNQGDCQEAECFTQRAIKIQEQHRASVLPVKLAQSYKLLGLIFESQAKVAQAVMCYQKAVEHSEGLKHVEFEIYQKFALMAAFARR